MFEEAICSYLQTHRFESLNLKAVLFDMDGVLFDSMKNHAAAWHEAMKRYNLQMTPEEAYLHEGRTGADTINIISTRQRKTEATAEEIEKIYQTKSEIFQKSLLERLNKNFPGIFKPELMVTAFDVKHGKPNPEPYLMGLQKAGVKASEAIVVENAPLGVKAGVAAGIFTVAVNTGPLPDEVLKQAGANLLFPSMMNFNNNWASFYHVIK